MTKTTFIGCLFHNLSDKPNYQRDQRSDWFRKQLYTPLDTYIRPSRKIKETTQEETQMGHFRYCWNRTSRYTQTNIKVWNKKCHTNNSPLEINWPLPDSIGNINDRSLLCFHLFAMRPCKYAKTLKTEEGGKTNIIPLGNIRFYRNNQI